MNMDRSAELSKLCCKIFISEMATDEDVFTALAYLVVYAATQTTIANNGNFDRCFKAFRFICDDIKDAVDRAVAAEQGSLN